MPSHARGLRARLLLALAISAVGCRTAPIYEPVDFELGAPSRAKLAQVATAIREAGASLNWVMTEQEPGVITGVTMRRCEIVIHFDTTRFSIHLVSSENLLYDAEQRTIHKSYNRWIGQLVRRIRQRASLI